MSSDRCSRRFDLRQLLPPTGTDGVAPYEDPDVAPPFEAEAPTDDPAERDVDETLAQIGLGGCIVCPLCGALVASDGSVLG